MIHTITLNPAIDKLLFINKFLLNDTTRIDRTEETLGGKGTHVSANLELIGVHNRAYGFCHGETGLRILSMLRCFGVDTRMLHRPSDNSRTNYILIDENNNSSIVAEKGVRLTREDIDELLDKLRAEIEPGDILVLSGDASNCEEPNVFNRITEALEYKRLKLFFDTSGDTLKHCINARPFFIKPNLHEMARLCNVTALNTDGEVISALNSFDDSRISVIAVTMGGKGSIVKTPEGVFRVYPPRVNMMTTAGCGDAFVAGFIYGLSKSGDMHFAISAATAVSSACAESALSVGFDRARVAELQREVRVEAF